MPLASPHLSIANSEGLQTCVPLGEQQIVIGRNAEVCQVYLPHDTVSREHCKVSKENGTSWRVTDNTSTNGTTLVTECGDRLNLQDLPDRSVQLRAGDRLLIPSQPQPCFTLTVVDPNRTQDAARPQANYTEISWVVDIDRQMLRCCFRSKEWDSKATLRPLPHKLLMHMAVQTQKHDGEILCTRDQLIEAVWGKNSGSESELNKLIKAIRDATTPSIIETRPGLGHVLKAGVLPPHVPGSP